MTTRGLRDALAETGRLFRIVGAHNALGARLAERAGFDGIWASSLEISASRGVLDESVLPMADMLHAAATMVDAVEVPIVADCDAGFGDASAVRRMTRQYASSGIAAVCIEDAAFPKRNSLAAKTHDLATIPEFCAKLVAAFRARGASDSPLLIARVEALIAGRGLTEAIRRAHAYREAGAEAILIHSKSRDPREVLEFVAEWDGSLPLVLIPTRYYTLSEARMRETGKVGMVIYANQGLRSSITAMRWAYRRILAEGLTSSLESRIATVQDIFDLQVPSEETARRAEV